MPLLSPPTPSTTSAQMDHPCLACGACCAHFRISFHWSEADPDLGGIVPIDLTEPLRRHERVMRGTSQEAPRCVALDAEIGVRSRCSIHPTRPSVCRAVDASWEFGAPSAQCDKARVAHGMAPLTPSDWAWNHPANDDGPDDNDNEPPALPPPIAA